MGFLQGFEPLGVKFPNQDLVIIEGKDASQRQPPASASDYGYAHCRLALGVVFGKYYFADAHQIIIVIVVIIVKQIVIVILCHPIGAK